MGESVTADSNTGDLITSESITGVPAAIFFVIGEIVAFFVYVAISRPMWFFLDEWDFLAGRTGGNLGDLFRPHNEHWVTLPVLVYRALWSVVGLHSYRPYQIVIVLLHLATAFLVRAVMRRAGVRPWTATVVASVLVFFGSGYQNIVLPFQMTLVGSLVFGLVHLLLAGHDGPIDRRDYFGLAAGCAALLCSGVGVAMVITVGIAMLIARGWRVALLHTVPLAGVYLVWFAIIGHEGYKDRHASLINVARFVRLIVAATFGALGHFRGVGIVLAVLLLVGLFVAWRPLPRPELRRRAAAPLGLLVGALALLCITGYGRAGHATFQEKSRYLHLVTAMMLPALAVAADAVMRRWRVLAPVVVVVLLVGVPGNINVIVNYMHKPIVANQLEYRQMMLSLPRVPVAKQVTRSATPDLQLAHFVTIGWLLDGVDNGRIPKPAHISPADEAVDTLRLSLGQAPGHLTFGEPCTNLATTSPVFHLEPGQSILVRAISGTAEITPASIGSDQTYPFFVITIAGSLVVAREPVTFRVSSVSPQGGQVCAAAPLMHAALADANAT
jgi:hypothetical protein